MREWERAVSSTATRQVNLVKAPFKDTNGWKEEVDGGLFPVKSVLQNNSSDQFICPQPYE